MLCSFEQEPVQVPERPNSTPLLVQPGRDIFVDRIMPSGKTLRAQWGVVPKTSFSSSIAVTEVRLGSPGPHVEQFV